MPSRAFDRILTGTALALVLGSQPHPGARPEPVGDRSAGSLPEPRIFPSDAAISNSRHRHERSPHQLPDPPDLPPPEFKDTPRRRSRGCASPVAAPRWRRPCSRALVVASGSAAARRYPRAVSASSSSYRPQDRPHRRRAFYPRATTRRSGSRTGPQASAQTAIAHLNTPTPTRWTRRIIHARHQCRRRSGLARRRREMRLTASALPTRPCNAWPRASSGRGDITYNQVAPESLDVLAKLATAKDAAAVLDSYQPPHAQYKRAQEARRRARPQGRGGPEKIAAGQTLKLVTDKRPHRPDAGRGVPVLRARLTSIPEERSVLRQAARRRGRGLSEGKGAATASSRRRRSRRSTASATTARTLMANWSAALGAARPRQGACGAEHSDFSLASTQGARCGTRVVVGKPGTPTRFSRRR